IPSSGLLAHHDKQVYLRFYHHAVVMFDRKKASALDRPTTFPKTRSNPQAISLACRLETPFKSLVHILGPVI
ncbi:hypothetical protein EV363DRAFT_1136363, partial [Boletus edulis]